MEVELLYKKIEDNLTSEEEKLVDEWLNASPSHLAYFERLKTHYYERTDFKPLSETLNTYRESYNKKIEAKFRRKRWTGYSAVLLVASIMLLLSVAVVMFYNPTENISEPSVIVADNSAAIAVEPIDTVPVYTEKKTNRKIVLAIGNNSRFGLSEISDRQVDNVEYDAENSMVTYRHENSTKPAEIHKLSTAAGAELCLRMEDGTTVWLNSNTEIEYPSYFAADARRVTIKGEAYFEVSHDPARPFIVSTGDMDVRVYGTQFNVNTRRHDTVTTTLVEGSVALIPSDSEKEIFLTPGETGKFDEATGDIKVSDDDIDLYIGWKNGAYHFAETSLKELFDEVAEWYGIEVSFNDESLENEEFSGIISRKMPLMDLLNILSQTNYIDFDLKNKHLIIKAKENN